MLPHIYVYLYRYEIRVIPEAFLQDLGEQKMLKMKEDGLVFNWTPAPQTSSSSSGDSATASQQQAASETVEQMKSMSFQASKLGYVGDALVTQKAAEQVAIWTIKSISDSSVSLVLKIDGEESEEKKLLLTDLLSGWRVHKGKTTEKLQGWSFETYEGNPLKSAAFNLKAAEGAVALALRKSFADQLSLLEHVALFTQPTMVKVTKAFKRGGLKLVAASGRIERKQSQTNINVGNVCGFDLYVAPHFSSPQSGAGEVNKTPFVAPFWMVSSRDDVQANMQIVVAKVDVGGFVVNVPIMQNIVALELGDELVCPKIRPTPTESDAGKGKREGGSVSTEVDGAPESKRGRGGGRGRGTKR